VSACWRRSCGCASGMRRITRRFRAFARCGAGSLRVAGCGCRLRSSP